MGLYSHYFNSVEQGVPPGEREGGVVVDTCKNPESFIIIS